MKKINNFDLSKHSTIGIGPVIDSIYIIEYIDDFNLLDNYKIIGNCSNILFKNDSYKNNFIMLGNTFNSFEVLDNNTIRVGAGIKINTLINKLSELDLGGLEFLFGIPATLGGLIKMNAGAFGKTIFDNIIGIQTNKEYLKKSDIQFSYRYTNIKDVILFADIKCEKKNKKIIKQETSNFIKKRQMSQPIGEKSLGSVFKNPSENIFAGKLIDDLGYKGKCINDICISEKHGNFIINKSNGNSLDFLKLSNEIINKVNKKYNIKLEYEIEIF